MSSDQRKGQEAEAKALNGDEDAESPARPDQGLEKEAAAETAGGGDAAVPGAEEQFPEGDADTSFIDLPLPLDLEDRVQYLNNKLKNLPDVSKIKPLKELALIGKLDSLRYILPLSRYTSEFVRKIARASVIKIILRTIREDADKAELGIQKKKNLVSFLIGLDKKYRHLLDLQLHDQEIIKKILDILIQEDLTFTARSLAEIICDSEQKVRTMAVKIIAEMIEEKESTILVKLLSDKDPHVRAKVIESLAALGNRNVIGILMKYKRDADHDVRANTLKALWFLGYRDIEYSLREMLLDENPKMRANGVWIIGEIGHQQSNFKRLLELVEGDEDLTVTERIKETKKKILWREKGLRILIIDNDKDYLRDLFRKLAGDGFHILAAFNGKDGVSTALRQKPDVIILNLRILKPNGMEVLKELKNNPTSREIPVIVTSDFHSSVLIKKSFEAGARDHILMPFSYEQVKEKIQMFS